MKPTLLFLSLIVPLSSHAKCHADWYSVTSGMFVRYSPIARAARVTGDVIVSFDVDGKGQVTDARPVSGPPMLISSTVEQVKSWKLEGGGETLAQKDCQVVFSYKILPVTKETECGEEVRPQLLQVSFTAAARVEISATPQVVKFCSEH